MDTTDTNITFNKEGVCDRCNQYFKDILPSWNKGEGKEEKLSNLVTKIKEAGKGKKYDCLFGMSGGFDSSYMLHYIIKELNLRPLVFHVDAGWNRPIAVSNIKKLVDKLNLELIVEKINWDEVRDFQLAYFKSGVPHLDIPQDLAFVSVLDNYAKKNNIKYVLNGGNISTEVIVNPQSWGYWGTDHKHNMDIIKRFGSVPMKTYPFTNIIQRKMIMPYIYGVKVVTPLNHIPYIKKDAEKLLKNEYGWEPYPQKHFESYMTMFIEGYWLPKRFGYDVRRPQFSSLILTGQMTREEALKRLKEDAIPEDEANELFVKIASLLEVSENELQSYFEMPLKTYKDYKHQDYMFDMGSKIMYWLRFDKKIRK